MRRQAETRDRPRKGRSNEGKRNKAKGRAGKGERPSRKLADARAAMRVGDAERALLLLDDLIEAKPRRDEFHRLKAVWLDRIGDRKGAEDALHRWADSAGELGKVEALTMLGRRNRSGRSRETRARLIEAAGRAEAKRNALLTDELPVKDRLSLLVATRDVAGLEAEIASLGPKAADLRPAVLRKVLEEMVRAGRTKGFLAAFGPDGEALPPRSGLIQAVLAGLTDDGEAELAMGLVARWSDVLERTDRVRACLVGLRLTTEGPDAAKAELDGWGRDEPENVARFRTWLRLVAGGSLPMAAEDRDALKAGLRAVLAEPSLAARDAVAAVKVLLEMDEPSEALDVALGLMERFPDSGQLRHQAYSAALRLADQEADRELRVHMILREEVDAAAVAAIGPDALLEAGGHVGVRAALFDAADTPADAAGLLTLARMFVAAVKANLKMVTGHRREARELHARGAANWGAHAAQTENAAATARMLCVLALRIDPADRDAATILFDLQRIAGGGPGAERLVVALCRHLLDEAQSLAREDRNRIWTAALSTRDRDLWAMCADRLAGGAEGDSRPAVVAIAGEDDEAGRTSTTEVHSKRIRVHGPPDPDARDDTAIDLTFPVFVDEAEPVEGARLHGGTLLEWPDGRGVARIAHARDVTPAGPFIANAGSRAIVLAPPRGVIEVREPALAIPCGRSHTQNYFHFTGQHLPRIVHWMRKMGSGRRLVVPDDLPGFALDLLRIAGLGASRLLPVPPDHVAILHDAVVTTPTTLDWQCAPDQIAGIRAVLAWDAAAAGRDRATAGPGFREAAASLAGPIAGPRAGERGRRFFLSRSHDSTRHRNRVLLNEEALTELAVLHGFEVVDPGTMGIDEQRRLFAKAAVICGPTGAALTNALYLPDGAQVIGLSPHETCRTYFPGLTLGVDVAFHWVLGAFDPTFAKSSRFPHLPYAVPVERLRAAFETLT